ncbi:MAG: serine/threonine-protein kinase [Isosphaeraceae bacterium]
MADGAPSPGDDAVIELEPTIGPEAAATSYIGGAGGPTIALSSQSPTLLRSRLRISAFFLLAVSLMFFAFRLATRDETTILLVVMLGIRVLIAGAFAGLLTSRINLSQPRLRVIEYALFGLMALVGLAGQYMAEVTLLRADDMPRLVAFGKNGVLSIVMLMTLYGVMIPNDPKVAARMICLLALGPFVLQVLEIEWYAEEQTAGHLAGEQNAMANALFIIAGAILAIVSAYTLNGLRGQLREARKLGQYHIGEKLGEGGMGEVYMAEHQFLKRPCALKLIRPEIHVNPIAIARFEREVQAAAVLTHPNSLEIYDYGRAEDGTFYYVMQYLPGLSVADIIDEYGPMPPGRVVYLVRQAAKALAEAHRVGLVHRDLKPANLFVAILGGACDVVKVLDFGLVKLTAKPDAVRLTGDYTVSGTPQYMSPEQATGSDDVDGRADIYALGAVMYYMVTGRPPFQGESPMEVMIAHVRDIVKPPGQLRPGLPEDLESVILRCLAKAAVDRYPDARALVSALSACSCAGDWDEAHAEAWWAEQAESHIQAAASAGSAAAAN